MNVVVSSTNMQCFECDHRIFNMRSTINRLFLLNGTNKGKKRVHNHSFRNLNNWTTEAAMSASKENKRVVIVGAGASGIAAATRLYENGIKDIVVLEAENRIGGRIDTIEIKNGILEMGAQWIHGEENNVVYELSSNRNLIRDSSVFDRPIVSRSCGEIVGQELTDRLLEIYSKLQEEPTENDLISFKNSGEFYIHILEKEFQKDENCDIPDDVKSEFIELCHQYINSYDASDTWFDTSVSTLTEYKTCEGNPTIMWDGVGFKTLFKILMEKSQIMSSNKFESDVIALNTEVEKISLGENFKIIIKCSNGRIIHADHVIVTVSLGVLKESHLEWFENFSIPELKYRSINNLELGTVDKLYLEFSEPWWPAEYNCFHLLWRKSDRDEYIEKGLGWIIDMFSVITVESAPNVLLGWISGPAARTMESLDELFVLETVTQVLRKFLSKRWKIPDPIRLIRSTWYSNKHFRGSYSNRSLRTENAKVSSSTLSLPINDKNGVPILLFAGEATSPHYYSTVHGAVESGWREADRLIPLIKRT